VQLETKTNSISARQAASRQEASWRWFLRKLLVMNIGLLVMALGIVATIRADMGVSPWDVLHIGLTYHLPISFGVSSQLVGLGVLIFACWLAKRIPTIGCMINIVMVGMYCDWLFPYIPAPQEWLWRIPEFAVGVVLCGYGAGMYISSRLGAGPRDWLMLGLSQKTGLQVRWVRTILEVTALLIGIVLGGPFAAGTILFSLTIGHPTQWGIKWAEKVLGPFVERREYAA